MRSGRLLWSLVVPSSQLSCVARLALVCLVAGCDASREDVLQLQVVVLQRQLRDAAARQEAVEEILEEVRSKLSKAQGDARDLETAVEELTSAVGEFGGGNWREIARTVESATEDVESAARSLESSIIDAARAARRTP